MTTKGNGGTNKLIWTALSVCGIVLLSLGMFLLNGSATRSQIIGAKLGEHGERITKAEARIDALESRSADLVARISALEGKLDRIRNPRPWETSPRR